MNIYDKKWLNELVDDDEISIDEQGFMHGYLEAFKEDWFLLFIGNNHDIFMFSNIK